MPNTRPPWSGRIVDRLRAIPAGWQALALIAAVCLLVVDLFSGARPLDVTHALPAGVTEIRDATAWHGTRATEAESAAAIALPALGPQLPLDSGGRAVLRVRFDWPDAPSNTLIAAYLGGSCGSFDVDLNGTALQREVEHDGAIARLCPRVQLIVLPSTLLHRRGNQLDLRLHGLRLAETSNARIAALVPPLWIGPLQTLQRELAHAEMVKVGLPRFIQIGLLLLGGIVLLMSRAGHKGLLLRLYGILLLVWSAVLGLIVWVDRPWLPAIWFDVLVVGLWTPTLAIAIGLLQAFSGGHPRWPKRLLLVQGALIPMGLMLGPTQWRFAWSNAWAVVLAVQALAAFTIYLTHRSRQRREEFWFGLATWTIFAAVWTLDALSTPSGLSLPLATAWIAASPFGWAALGLLTGTQIVLGLTRAVSAAETRRSLHQARIVSVTSVVERNFAHLAELRMAQMTDRERKRIASELHDDLGGKLLTIVHTCNDERIATLGREALDEMRLSVRGLSSKPMPVGDAVADWRAETITRLGKTRTRLEWHSHGDTSEQTLSARTYVQITRILREALSNIARHSEASRCSIRLVAMPGRFVIIIEDDGRGLPDAVAQGASTGHGLANMKQRARQLDGSCEISSVAGKGTEIRLEFPL